MSKWVMSVGEAGLEAMPEDLLIEGPSLTAQFIGRLLVLPVLDEAIAVAG